MRKLLIRLAVTVIGCLGLAGTGSAYYYYVHFPSGNGPFVPILEKYDLSTLPNNTVTFFVTDAGPSKIYPNDTFQAIVSEIRTAAGVWNSVPTSTIRLAYGGLFTSGTQESAPGIDVEFSNDIPPGLLALSGPRVPGGETGAITVGVSGPFVPILRSKLLLLSDMSQMPSFSDAFFVTLVHEFGHTLGLQHTLASTVMSTLVTSASSKAAPLGADDIAGISLLYPTSAYLSTVGTISGRVTLQGKGVNLASVVAIAPNNQPLSALTNPDGTYQIAGLNPNISYYVYVHPLPPPLEGETTPANISLPVDSKGSSDAFQPNVGFATQFYSGPSGTRDWHQAQPITAAAGTTVSGIDFQVSPRSYVAVYAVRTYGYSSTNVPEASPPLNILYPAAIVASGPGLLQKNEQLAPGLSVSELGNSAQVYNLQPYNNTGYVLMAVQVFSGLGPAHMLFSTPNDLYVLPTAFKAVNTSPPSISSVTPAVDKSGNRLLEVKGGTLSKDSRILFDGEPVVSQTVAKDGGILVTPPQAPAGYTATVVALNPDGQSSLYLQGQNPSTYTYSASAGASVSPSLAVAPGTLSSGQDVLVDVVGTGTNFIDGQTVVGFGTSDVYVKQVTVLSPTHLTVLVTPNVSWSTYAISITTGLNIIAQSQGALVGPQSGN